MKQILEIAAIVPGQTPHRKFNIPALSRTNTNDPAASGNHAIEQSQPVHGNANPEVSKSDPDLQPKQETFGDLIDLSDPIPNKDADVIANKPGDNLQLNSGKKAQEEFPDDLPPSKLLNFVKDEPGRGHTLQRLDTETEDEEQFHDAIS